jgi:hypothetical protein
VVCHVIAVYARHLLHRKIAIKGSENEKQGGVEKVANDKYRSWTVVTDVPFSFYLAAILE